MGDRIYCCQIHPSQQLLCPIMPLPVLSPSHPHSATLSYLSFCLTCSSRWNEIQLCRQEGSKLPAGIPAAFCQKALFSTLSVVAGSGMCMAKTHRIGLWEDALLCHQICYRIRNGQWQKQETDTRYFLHTLFKRSLSLGGTNVLLSCTRKIFLSWPLWQMVMLRAYIFRISRTKIHFMKTGVLPRRPFIKPAWLLISCPCPPSLFPIQSDNMQFNPVLMHAEYINQPPLKDCDLDIFVQLRIFSRQQRELRSTCLPNWKGQNN